jgi:hypothetical protein
VLQQLAVFAAGFLTAITGFGFNALSLPLLAVAFEPHHAVVVGLLVGLLIFALVLLLPGVRQAVDWRLVWTLFAWSLLGLPLGARILVLLDDRALRLVIGGLTFLYAAGQLTGVLPTLRASRRASPYVGVLSGILSSSVSMGGTPIMVYLIGLGGLPRHLRATAVAYVILSTIGSLPLRQPRPVPAADAGAPGHDRRRRPRRRPALTRQPRTVRRPDAPDGYPGGAIDRTIVDVQPATAARRGGAGPRIQSSSCRCMATRLA